MQARAPRLEDLPNCRTVCLEVLRVLRKQGACTRRQLVEVHDLPSTPLDKWLKRLQILGFIEVTQGERAPGAIRGTPPALYRLTALWRGDSA